MQDSYESLDEQDLIQEAKDIAKRDWTRKAYNCTRSGTHHDIMPVAWKISSISKEVTVLMCKRCFHQMNIAETQEHKS